MTVVDRVAQLSAHAELIEQLRHDCPAASTSDSHELYGFYVAVKSENPKHTDEDLLLVLASKRLQATQAWRTAINLDALMEDPAWMEAEREYRKLLLYNFLGSDQHGRPIMVERCGAWDVCKIVVAAEEDFDKFLKLHAMACETLRRHERPQECRDPRGQIIIMDCAGFGMRHLTHAKRLAKLFSAISRIDAAHFPDTLAHIFVVNTPVAFSALAMLVRPFLAAATLEKVHVSRSVPRELVETVGADALPAALGGSRRGVFPYDDGTDATPANGTEEYPIAHVEVA